MSLPIVLVSQMTLEEWDWETPWKTGIGGSETGHIECAIRLAARGHKVISLCPLPKGKHNRKYKGVLWKDVRKTNFPTEPCIILNYRHPKYFDRKKPKGQVWWFVAQDVDYDGHWTQQAQAQLDRFLALCETHADFTLAKYPQLRDKKVYVTSNGIRTDYIEKLPLRERNPYGLFWASSPDRGLLMLLQQWFRIRERFPKAELRIAYGFNNMDTIIQYQGPQSPLIQLRNELQTVADQPGVTWLGRLTQDKVFAEWQKASIFPYCSDWPETSCISIMEAMACGAVPVTTNHWAQGEHALKAPLAYVNDGLPQRSELARSIWLGNLYAALEGTLINGESRNQLATWAQENFNWERIIDQWDRWIQEDNAKPKRKRKVANGRS